MPLVTILLIATVACVMYLPWLAVIPVITLLFVLNFFRDPSRSFQAGASALISPADGKVVEIAEVPETEHIKGTAIKVAIFMSVLDVHVNRAPYAGKVEWTRHEPGVFLNALRSQASIENELMLVALRSAEGRPVLVKQVAGLVARRIVCPLKSGDVLERGQRFGMIKFGSRVEVFVPGGGTFHPSVRLGQRVRAGETVLGEWR